MVKGQTKSSGARKSDRLAIKDWPVTERPREKLLSAVLGSDQVNIPVFHFIHSKTIGFRLL